MTVPAPLIRSVAAGLLAAAALAAGCGEAAHSQQVRREARDRYDRAGAQISYDQARQAFQSGQFQEALDQVDRAIARFPKEASYQLLRGRILHEMTRVEEAHRSFASAAELDPRKPEPHYFMGIIHQRWREHDRALASYAAAAKLDETKLHFVAAEVEMLTVLGRHEDAHARIASIERRFEFSPVLDRLRADVHKVRGDHAACADALERAALRETSSPELLEELAFARYSKGDWAGSLAVLDDPALDGAEGRPDMVRLRARNLILLGRPGEARDALLAVRGQPDPEGRTALLLGHAAWRLGEWARLRQCGEDLVRLQPRTADGYLFIGAAEGGMGRLGESLAMFEQALMCEPDRDVCRRMVFAAAARVGGPADECAEAAAGAVRADAP
jgi:tetratricopeptide (TPR) repeat protein